MKSGNIKPHFSGIEQETYPCHKEVGRWLEIIHKTSGRSVTDSDHGNIGVISM